MDTFVWTATDFGQAEKSFHSQTHLCVFKGNVNHTILTVTAVYLTMWHSLFLF